ncbi:MAG: hypothetical protein R2847_10055 [Bacteroidia bacterium]
MALTKRPFKLTSEIVSMVKDEVKGYAEIILAPAISISDQCEQTHREFSYSGFSPN